jgi:hypothetical protein
VCSQPIGCPPRKTTSFVPDHRRLAAGIAENLFNPNFTNTKIIPDLTCPVACCDGVNCSPEVHKHHHTFLEKLDAGVRFAVLDLWGDLAGWFFVGLLFDKTYLMGIINIPCILNLTL